MSDEDPILFHGFRSAGGVRFSKKKSKRGKKECERIQRKGQSEIRGDRRVSTLFDVLPLIFFSV